MLHYPSIAGGGHTRDWSVCGQGLYPRAVRHELGYISEYGIAALGRFRHFGPPGTTAELFAPAIVRTGLNTRDVAITPEGTELYFSTNDDDHTYSTIYVTRIADGTWTEPQIAPFATDTRYRFGEPFLSPEGARLYFVSTRPVDGSEVPNDYDLWFMERVGCPPESRGPRQLGPQ